jgi:three-Cys-motif partner protein
VALQFDEIGYWSEIKLDIIKEYAAAYSRILSKNKFHHVYIDGFAGAGQHVSKATKEFVAGSPLNALNIEPPFREYHLIDLNRNKAEHLRSLIGERRDVTIYNDDCNDVLLTKVFPRVKYKDFRRGLCILDPYGLHLDWAVMAEAARMKTLEIFLNFPVMDMNMNVLRQKGANKDEDQTDRMTAFWGDESWRDAGYKSATPLFPSIEDMKEKETNAHVAQAFRERLRKVAGFAHVPEPLPMTNTNGAIVYYLFFASHKQVAEHIVEEIFEKYRGRLRKSKG